MCTHNLAMHFPGGLHPAHYCRTGSSQAEAQARSQRQRMIIGALVLAAAVQGSLTLRKFNNTALAGEPSVTTTVPTLGQC